MTGTDSPTCLVRTGLMSHERGTPLAMHLEDESERSCWYSFGRFANRFFCIPSPCRCSHVINTASPNVFLVVGRIKWRYVSLIDLSDHANQLMGAPFLNHIAANPMHLFYA